MAALPQVVVIMSAPSTWPAFSMAKVLLFLQYAN